MLSTMQDFPLTIGMLFRHGRKVHGKSQVVTWTGDGARRASFAEVGTRVEKLAAALSRLGVRPGDRVATFCWNTQEHLEAYFAVPCMGAVLHTLNLRLFPDQLTYVVNHGGARVVIVDDTLVPLLARVAGELEHVEHFIVVGDGDASALGSKAKLHRYDALLAAESGAFDWPEVDERSAMAMCYTTGTTGDPKGVVYSHRSTVLHTYGVGWTLTYTDRDRVLPVVPMFHANAWGLPYVCWTAGADLVMPGRFLQAEPLARMIEAERVTCAGAVPSIWNELLRYVDDHPADLSSMKRVACGGSAVPRALIEAFEQRHGVQIIQGWGMTETSPLAAAAFPPKDIPAEEALAWRAKTGRILAGVELRITDDDGRELPWDGESVGEIEVRGPWITASYYLDDTPEKFHDGWLRTGDVAKVDEHGFVQITDRSKDVIKSGGEWISSVELENVLMGHPSVFEAAVVGVPDSRWDERPLACVVLKPNATASADELRAFLAGKVAKWWLPERWAFLDELPKTSVGKFDKKVLRARHAQGEIAVVTVAEASR
jgi:fatty-acyl-CoA synthase